MQKIILTLLVIILAISSIDAQQLVTEQMDVISGSGVYNANCIIYYPANYNSNTEYPLVIFTHGMGEAGTDISKLYNSGLPKVLKDGYRPPFNFIMVAPQRASYSVDPAWLPAIIDESNKRWKINNSRIYITGLSAGGWACYGSQLNIDTILAKKFAAIVPLSAATQDANKNNFDWFKVSKTPLWAVVGGSDPSYRDQNIYMVGEINKRVPNLASITIRAGIGHGGWNDVYNGLVKTTDGKNMWEWMYQFTNENSLSGNQFPVANAGTDKTITFPVNSVQLTGNGSDLDGNITAFSWSKISGPYQFTINNPEISNPIISNLAAGIYVLRLTVTDNAGAFASDDVNINVIGASNQLPDANAGMDMNLTLPTNSVQLNGSATDPDGTISKYGWSKISGPVEFTISNSATANPFISNLVEGTYVFRLTVTDNSGGTATDDISIIVNPQSSNVDPIANAGNDIVSYIPGNWAKLNGSASSDPDGSISSYTWSKISGPSQFTINSYTIVNPVLTNLVAGIYIFRLNVTDNAGASSTDDVKITVYPQ